MSGLRVLASPMILIRLITPGKQPLSTESGITRYTFYWQCREPGKPRMHGIGFTVRNSLLSSTEPLTIGTARILSLRLSTSSGPATILSVYAPTLSSTAEAKDQFYEELETTIREIPAAEKLFLLGDFIACVEADHNS